MYVLSVPHSGTRWVLKHLREWGHEVGAIHTNDPKWREVVASEHKIVVPLRDPVMVGISALNRDERSLAADFNDLAPLVGRVHFVRVDCRTGDRDSEIRALCDYLEIEPGSVDWAPYGSEDDHLSLKAPYLEHGVVPVATNVASLTPETREVLWP